MDKKDNADIRLQIYHFIPLINYIMTLKKRSFKNMSDDFSLDTMVDDLIRGSFDTELDSLMEMCLEQHARQSGLGSYNSRVMMTLSKFDRYGYTGLDPNHETAGFTFITRPQLNLSTTSLMQHRIMQTLNTGDPLSLEYSLRAYLAPRWASSYIALSRICPFFNHHSPFLIPISNRLIDFSGFPDFSLDTETTASGYYNEDQTIVRGSDFGNRTYDASMTINDISGGYLFFLFFYWTMYMALVSSKGIMMPYSDYLSRRRLDYSCAIYRFTLDESRTYVRKWSKATGCFPTGLPSGNMFNINQNEYFVNAARTFSVNFKINHYEIMDPIIITEFNNLVKMFCPDAFTNKMVNSDSVLKNNFTGIPTITTDSSNYKVQFRAYKEELEDIFTSRIDSYTSELETMRTLAANNALTAANNTPTVNLNSVQYA